MPNGAIPPLADPTPGLPGALAAGTAGVDAVPLTTGRVAGATEEVGGTPLGLDDSDTGVSSVDVVTAGVGGVDVSEG